MNPLLTSDALDGLLAITPLSVAARNAAASTNGADKVMSSMPMAVAAILSVSACPAAHTLTVSVEGRNLSTDGYTSVATFTQVTNANFATPQRRNIAQPFKRYRGVDVTTGAFGAGVFVSFALILVGTRVKFAPITQVD